MTEEDLVARIREAFDDVPRPARLEEMMLSRYDGDDAYQMARALLGKRWQDLPMQLIFYHRQALTMMSAAAYRAYLPAYLEKSVAPDDPTGKYTGDVIQYVVLSLGTLDYVTTPFRAEDTRERLSLLDDKQRAVVKDVLAYLATRWEMEDAVEVLRAW